MAGLAGGVIEVGAGAGSNFAHYPATVEDVVAVKPELYLRERARTAASANVRIEVLDGVADRLPADDASFDAAVACLVLCTVPDQAHALAELRRVLRPGGELLRFYEHVRSDRPVLALSQRAVDWAFWPRAFGGCHTARDTPAAIQAAALRARISAACGSTPCRSHSRSRRTRSAVLADADSSARCTPGRAIRALSRRFCCA